VVATEAGAAPPEEVRPEPVNVTAETQAREGVTAYPADFFKAYAPNTALDMVNRLPGFNFDRGAGNGVRGLAGSTGNVLIDGARPASKSDSIESQLNRISAAQVERIELIRGGAPGIDMQGRSEVANIIRKSADSLTQSATVRVEHFTEDGRFLPGFRYELARKTGERTLELGLGRFIGYDDSTGSGRRVRRDPLGVVLRDEGVTNESDGYTHQVNAAYKTPLLGGVLRVNGLANINDFKSESHFNGTAGELDVVDVSDDANQEFGGTFTRDFGPKWSAELLGLYKAGQSEFRSASEGYGADSGLFLAEEDTGERIVRLTLKHRWSDRLSFEAGGETAFNFLDGAIAFQENGVAKTLPSSNVRVEEDRSELFALANWRPRTDLTVEAGMRFERSTIRQIGDNAREREFQYPKPRFLATWTPNPRTTLRFRAERELGQLDFGDFVSSTDLTTDVVAAGNPELEPDKTWVYEVTGERRFWDTGALSVTLRHEEITDVIDRIPIDVLDPATGLVTSTLEAPGNIGDGTNDELELNVTLPLTRFGLTGAELKLEAEWRNSEVIDPTTGESRRISRQRPDEIEVTYRQDFPAQKLALTAAYFDGWKETNYNFNQVSRFDLSEYVEVGVEYKPRPSTFVSLALSNATAFEFKRFREVYSGRRNVSPLLFTESRENESQQRLILRVRQTWG
jgi:hypothetical protein